MTRAESLTDLKKTLEEIGLPQTKAAKILDINPQYLNQVLMGRRSPGEDLYKEILKLNQKLKRSGLVAAV